MVIAVPQRYVAEFGAIFPQKRWCRLFGSSPVSLALYDLRPRPEWVHPLREHSTIFRLQEILGRPGPDSRCEIPATEDEIAGWSRARMTAETAIGAASAQLVSDCGLRIVENEAHWPYLRWGLRPVPGRRAARRRWNRPGLRRAFDEFRERMRCIDDEYRPVRMEIAARTHEQEVRRLEAEQERARRSERIRVVAAHTVWSYRVDENDRVVHVFRAHDSSLDTRALARQLREDYGPAGGYSVRWEQADRAKVEQDSGVDFDTWWCAVTPNGWIDSHRIPDPPPAYRSGNPHTGFGIGTGGGGSFGCAGGF